MGRRSKKKKDRRLYLRRKMSTVARGGTVTIHVNGMPQEVTDWEFRMPTGGVEVVRDGAEDAKPGKKYPGSLQ